MDQMKYKKEKLKYFTYDEICIHNVEDDLWVIVNKVVFNLTPLIADRKDSMNNNLQMLLAYGGKDLSSFFDDYGKPRNRVPIIPNEIPYLFKAAAEVAYSNYAKTPGMEWWKDPFYIIGRVTERDRCIRIFNTLTATIQEMKVCEEDTISDIFAKYRYRYNSHTSTYCFRKFYDGRTYPLQFNKTLTQNGLHHEQGPSSLWIYYNDDFTVA